MRISLFRDRDGFSELMAKLVLQDLKKSPWQRPARLRSLHAIIFGFDPR